MQKKESKAWIWIIISIVTVIIVLIIAIFVVMGRALGNGVETGAKVIREELGEMLSAVEEEDFATFESYYATGVINGNDTEEAFMALREFLGEDAVLGKGRAISSEFSSNSGGWTGDMTMTWEVNTSKGDYTIEVRRIFETESSTEGIIYLEISSDYESIYLG